MKKLTSFVLYLILTLCPVMRRVFVCQVRSQTRLASLFPEQR